MIAKHLRMADQFFRHRALARHAKVAVGFFGLVPEDRVLQYATLKYDGIIEQLLAPQLAGSAVVLRGP